MMLKDFFKEVVTKKDTYDLIDFLEVNDFSIIDADFPTENHMTLLAEYRGGDVEMDGIDDYYVEVHFEYSFDEESDEYDDRVEELCNQAISGDWDDVIDSCCDCYIWIRNIETDEEYVTDGVVL